MGHDAPAHQQHAAEAGGHVTPKRAPMGTPAYIDNITAFEPTEPMPKPRGLWERYRRVAMGVITQDGDIPSVGSRPLPQKTWWDLMTRPLFPMRPETYRDAYLRPNPCPEEFHVNPWRWAQTKLLNPKIPPPVDGKYNDMYHYMAYRGWHRKERDVYVQHTILLREALDRCLVKEGVTNGRKNCKHLWHKYFAMSRMEELNQTLLYMAITGENAIRETPYPEDFVDRKRKVYDDWLFRTRMRKPGDNY